LRVILLNLGREPYTVHAGDRIAQMIVARYEAVEWLEGDLADSSRAAPAASDRRGGELPMYSLEVAKGGPKLKESAATAPPDDANAALPAPAGHRRPRSRR
jgi:hypothetical protein